MVLITLVWVGGALFACVPLLAGLGLSFTDAYFESMSALTATGATLLSGLDSLAPSFNVWRAELQWLGGMGVIVLVVAVLPMIGVGGRQISKAEIPGPMKEEQLTPRMTQTAKGLWMIYFALTFACLIAYRLAGMTWIDALIHSFSTLSLGGFSSHDASIAFFDSVAIEFVAIVFMMLAGINFATHFQAWRARSVSRYRDDSELPYFLAVLAASVAGVTAFLSVQGVYPDWLTTLRYAAFNTVSVATNTGYATVDYAKWPVFAPLWLMFLGTFAACSGSAGGGIKMIRAMVLFQQVQRELARLAHPAAVTPAQDRRTGRAQPGGVRGAGVLLRLARDARDRDAPPGRIGTRCDHRFLRGLCVTQQYRAGLARSRAIHYVCGADRLPDLDLHRHDAAGPPGAADRAGHTHAIVLAEVRPSGVRRQASSETCCRIRRKRASRVTRDASRAVTGQLCKRTVLRRIGEGSPWTRSTSRTISSSPCPTWRIRISPRR
jgi:hypothetical protein